MLALAMVLCMIPVSFAASYSVSSESYDLAVAALDANGNYPSFDPNKAENPGWAEKDDSNSITFEYNYEKLSEVTTGKFTENRKMAVVRIGGLQGNFTEVDEITIDGKLLEVNEYADYVDDISANYKWALDGNAEAILFPVELTKAGYSDTYLVEITGKGKNAQNEVVDVTETIKITVKLVNTASYKNGKDATIASIKTQNRQILNTYIVGDRIYVDYVGKASNQENMIKITFKDNNGDLFDVTTWAYGTSCDVSNSQAVIFLSENKGTEKEDGLKLKDSAALFDINGATAAGTSGYYTNVVFKLETASAIYETDAYTVVVRENIKETDPKGIVFAESSKTIKVGESFSPVVLGVATGTQVNADISAGAYTDKQVVDFKDSDSDGVVDAVIGTKEGVAYVTATYQPVGGTKYTALGTMKITVTSGTVTDDTAAGKTYMVTASSLRVRSGAGTNFSQIGSLKNGATVKVESIANGW
ncbi:MAG: SH3 domain-containing protein, partial [Candidatus Spyradocola sp.]